MAPLGRHLLAGLGERAVDLLLRGAAYLALLGAVAETLTGDPVATGRAALDAEATVADSGDRWYLSLLYVDLAHATLAQGRA
jgi:hypothetical protein